MPRHKIRPTVRDSHYAKPECNRNAGKTLLVNKVPGNIVGCDFSGVVVELGAEVDSRVRKIGERVAGFIHGGELLSGHMC